MVRMEQDPWVRGEAETKVFAVANHHSLVVARRKGKMEGGRTNRDRIWRASDWAQPVQWVNRWGFFPENKGGLGTAGIWTFASAAFRSANIKGEVLGLLERSKDEGCFVSTLPGLSLLFTLADTLFSMIAGIAEHYFSTALFSEVNSG